eukprot:8646343-Alexandrium_andersonii.AAC.1
MDNTPQCGGSDHCRVPLSGPYLCRRHPGCLWGLRRTVAALLGGPSGGPGSPTPPAGRERPGGGRECWVDAPSSPTRH